MFVIFGASGKVGSATATALRDAGKPVRAVVRHARDIQRFAAIGCETAIADLTDARSVRSAIEGAHAVQILCPVPLGGEDPRAQMRAMIDTAADALRAAPPPAVLALSDYGAELSEGTGITVLYHYLETRFKPIPTRLTLLRSAEHMENWARVASVALDKGVLPSMHHPLTKAFPTVSAQDVGLIAAELLLDGTRTDAPRIVSVEGPKRVDAHDVAQAVSELAGRTVTAVQLPRGEWKSSLLRAGLSARHIALISELFDAHNAGRIDIEEGVTERRFGATTLSQAFSSLLAARRREAP